MTIFPIFYAILFVMGLMVIYHLAVGIVELVIDIWRHWPPREGRE